MFSTLAQVSYMSSNLQAIPKGSTFVMFDSEADLDVCTIPDAPVKWGMDVAWDSEDNVRRGTNFIGSGPLQTGRISFQPSDLVDANGNLSPQQQAKLQSRLNHIAISGVHNVIVNCDHEALNSNNYYGKPYEWYRVIKATVKYAQSKGFTVTTVSPFNEPDYTSWGEGTKAHFKEICRYISEDPEMEGIRISAGNTLNCDQALSWYNYMKPYVSEGNTHQLAGEFSNYAKFWQTVRTDGNVATADELHNTMEALVGIHYGMQYGVWWGYDAACRGEFCKSSYTGKEIGYGENRTNWAAGAVYKRDNGRIDAFLGVSERQAKTTDFELVSTKRAVYFDGVGPQYTYVMQIPGGTGYATDDQRNAERMVQISYGPDVPVEPIVAGDYVLMCQGSGYCLGYTNGAAGNGVLLGMGKYTGTNPAKHQQWTVEPIDSRSGGDFGYFVLRSVRDNSQVADVLNWSLEAGGGVCGYAGGLGTNEQWFTEYAGDGYYYIRSRHSGLYLEAKTKYASSGIQQNIFTGNALQRWRFMPIKSALDQTPPAVPQGLEAHGLSGSVRLNWNANTENDCIGYEILRGTITNSKDTLWDVIARMVPDLSFVDNDLCQGQEYCYAIRAVDRSRNRSNSSDILSFYFNPERALVAHYSFDRTAEDASQNMLHGAAYAETYSSMNSKEGVAGLSLDGSKTFVALPSGVASLHELSFGLWFNQTNYSSSWTRLIDFGNGVNQYMFVTPNNGSQMRLVLKNGGDEQILACNAPGAGWHHLMVTMGEEHVELYLDGVKQCETEDISIRPADFRPVLNYVGRSQYDADPLFKGFIDDLRIYNYPLSPEEVQIVYGGGEIEGIEHISADENHEPYYNLNGQRINTVQDADIKAERIRISNGRKLIIR